MYSLVNWKSAYAMANINMAGSAGFLSACEIQDDICRALVSIDARTETLQAKLQPSGDLQ